MFTRAVESVSRILQKQWVWYIVAPLIVGVGYAAWLASFGVGRVPGSVRIPAIGKVFFDHTFYLSMVSKDVFHGSTTLPTLLRPWLEVIHASWPMISLAEWYILGVIASSVLSMWGYAWFFQQAAEMDAGAARVRSVCLFALTHALLVLRPGGPSWYVPFFLLALILVWLGDVAWDRKRVLVALFAWVVAVACASVYAWYMILVLACAGTLLLYRVVRPSFVVPGAVVGIGIALLALMTRDAWVPSLLSSQLAVLAVRNGFAWSYLPVLGNTMIAIAWWWLLWIVIAFVRSRSHASEVQNRQARYMAIAWGIQFCLWFQSSITGFSIIPDHFIYTVWLLALVSCGLLFDAVPSFSTRWTWVFRGIAFCAWGYVLFTFVRMIIGPYRWNDFPSLLIHISVWLLLAITLTPISTAKRIALSAILSIGFIGLGVASVEQTARVWAAAGPVPDDLRAWFVTQRPSTSLRWCTDVQTAERLAANTDQLFSPLILEKQESVPRRVLQERLIEVARFFDVSGSGQMYVWDDMILNDEDFACRVFGPARDIVHRLPIRSSVKTFLIGCDEESTERERQQVVAEMNAAWAQPIASNSMYCDGFVVRSDLLTYWRIPSTYRPIYTGVGGIVYGRATSTVLSR